MFTKDELRAIAPCSEWGKLIDEYPSESITAQNIIDNSPSHILVLAMARSSKISEELVDAGIDIDLKDDLGRTALLIAVLYKNDDVVTMLKSLGASENIEDDLGRTPASIAEGIGYDGL